MNFHPGGVARVILLWGSVLMSVYAEGESAVEKPSALIKRKVVESYRKDGSAAALAVLEREYVAYRQAKGEFYDLYAAMWNEAQMGSGRNDAMWNAALFDWVQKKSMAEGFTGLAEQVTHNTYSGFTIIARYGAARQALQPLIACMKERGIERNMADYPDKGVAFDFLPEVRLREVKGRLRSGWPQGFEYSMQDLAEEEFCAGDWRQALERLCWLDSHMAKEGVSEAEEWLLLHQNIAFLFYRFGLYEAADAEYARVLANEASHKSYYGRSRLVAGMGRLKIRMLSKDKAPKILEELDEIAKKGADNNLLYSAFRFDVERARAMYFKNMGNYGEAEKVLKRCIAEDSGHGVLSSRIDLIRLRLDAGRLDGLEEEIRDILIRYRAFGRKHGESSLYSAYAELLEKLGRPDEALVMRREAVRLCRSFDWFVDLPVELARLSILLGRCNQPGEAAKVAAEAMRLVSDGRRIPARIRLKVEEMLGAGGAALAHIKTKKMAQKVDFQPIRAVIVPLAGMPHRGEMTLANPSSDIVSGKLSVKGQAATLTWNPQTQQGVIVLGGDKKDNRIDPLRIAPGTFAGISLQGDSVDGIEGEVTVVWSAEGRKEQTSVWTLERGEAGVSSAIIQAAEYRNNPFYSVPMFHHYQDNAEGKRSVPIRVSTTATARVEMYDAGDKPVSVDARGDGSLADVGDSIFQDADFDGVADLPLAAGETMLRLQVYPLEKLAKDGMEVVIEGMVDGKWHVFSKDRIIP